MPVIWYPAPVGAKCLPALSPWGSSHWRDPEEYDGIGEQMVLNECTNRRAVEWTLPIPPAPYDGQEYCGSLEAFLHGADPDSPDLFMTNEIGQAPCCASEPLIVWEGGSAQGGGWLMGRGLIVAEGGERVGGPTGEYHITDAGDVVSEGVGEPE